MELVSGTIRSASIAISSTLREEKLDDILAVDWWFNNELGNQRRKTQRERQAVVESKVTSAPATRPTPKLLKWWWQLLVASGVLGGLVVFALESFVAHYSRDSATQISDEITKQLDQRKAADAENLSNRISAEVGRQLSPMYQQISRFSQDIGKIKDHLGIAHNATPNVAPSHSPPVDVNLHRFEKMDEKQFAMSLSSLKSVTERSSPPRDQVLLRNIAEKLRRTDSMAPAYWPTVFAFITWTSEMSAKNVPPPNTKTNFVIASKPPEAGPATFEGLVVGLNGGEINGLVFRDCRIRFTSTAVRMNNVTFVNCVFEFPSVQTPTPYLKSATKQLLEADNLGSVSLNLRG